MVCLCGVLVCAPPPPTPFLPSLPCCDCSSLDVATGCFVWLYFSNVSSCPRGPSLLSFFIRNSYLTPNLVLFPVPLAFILRPHYYSAHSRTLLCILVHFVENPIFYLTRFARFPRTVSRSPFPALLVLNLYFGGPSLRSTDIICILFVYFLSPL